MAWPVNSVTWPNRILILHNRYKHPGGEDIAVSREVALLRTRGHHVRVVIVDNYEGGKSAPLEILQSLAKSNWSWSSYEKIHALCKSWAPDIVHLHNYWFQLTPSAFNAVRDAGCPLVVTLHNFRPLCPAGVMTRNGRPCEECLGKTPWRGIAYRCYHDSVVASSAVARMSLSAKRRGLWQCGVDLYLTPSQWAREIYIRGGFPENRLAIHPHYLDVHPTDTIETGVQSIVCVGRLSEDKGIYVLMDAWKQLRNRKSVELVLVGGGPLFESLRGDRDLHRYDIRMVGHKDATQTSEFIARSIGLVQPSLCYETFGLSILEAFSHGKPAVASRIGALPELVRDCETGILVTPGDCQNLSNALQRFIDSPQFTSKLGTQARQLCKQEYTSGDAHNRLIKLYERALALFRHG